MSTGAISLLLHSLPYTGHWLLILSYIVFILNITLFLLCTLLSILRYTFYPSLFLLMLKHPHQSLFLAAIPVGGVTIINMLVLVCEGWGQGWVLFAWGLWWVDGLLAVMVGFYMAWVIMTNHRPVLSEMTSLWLIPVVSIVAASSSGALLAGALTDPRYKLWTLVLSYVYWGVGMPFAYMVLTVYFLRLTVHKPLAREVIVSALLPVGPLGLGTLSIITLSKTSLTILPTTHSLPLVANAGETLYAVSFLLGLLIWAFGLLWFVVAVFMIAMVGKFPFNMGWWGFVFPVGIYTLATITIGNELNSKFFKMLGEVLSFILTLLWLLLFIKTIFFLITGDTFMAPCLGTDLKGRRWIRGVKRKDGGMKGDRKEEDNLGETAEEGRREREHGGESQRSEGGGAADRDVEKGATSREGR